ncbi:hypothetical protein Tco_0887216 [Tanacetum coccineum]
MVRHLKMSNTFAQYKSNNASTLKIWPDDHSIGRSSNMLDGQSIDVDAPPDIIDVDEDDYIIDEEDPIPQDLADSDDEDLINLDIDDAVNVVYSSEEEDLSLVVTPDVARGHGGDGGSDDHPPPYQIPTGYGGCLGNRGKGTRKPNLGGRPSLTCVLTWNPIASYKSMRAYSSICKRSTMARRLLSRKGVGFLARTGLKT